ncbi:Heterokaryon incompatibility protein (HET) domain containing protein [Rhypophila sp. PSN 637]
MSHLATSYSRFQYAPIDLATDAIRLVRLLKGSDYEPIVCELFETLLHQVNGTPYEALSYTWGQSQELIQITLCGKKVLIRDNLFTALWYLRKPDEDRLLWIDAICIDQQSHLEKGHQVGQMRLIYQNAQNVHVWLGQSTDDIDMLMNHMNQLDKRALRRPDYRRNSPTAWENEWPILQDELDKLRTNNSNFHVRRCAAAMDLLGRPWFRRVWIIQEVFNAKIATVGCGLNSLPTRTFVLIPKLLGLDQFVGDHVQSVLEIMPGCLRQRSWHSQRPTLHTLLRKFASCEATDLRDKVYALVGISSDAGMDGKLQPDYDTAVTMERVLHRTLSYLVFGEDSSSDSYARDLPTWDLETIGRTDPEVLPKVLLDWSLMRAFEGETTIQLLTQSRVDPNHLHKDGEPPLLFMATSMSLPSKGWGSVVAVLLQNPLVDVNITSPDSQDTPLNRAVDYGNYDMVKRLLLRKDIDVNHLGDRNKPPLWAAVERELTSTGIVSTLLEHPQVDINYGGCGALREALERGNLVTASVLLRDSRLDITRLEEHHGPRWMKELLKAPARLGDFAVLKQALDLLEPFQGTSFEEALVSTVLLAVSKSQVSCIDVLLDRIAKLPGNVAISGNQDPGERQRTPLHAVAESRVFEMNRVALRLINAGVSVNKRDDTGRSALWVAASYGRTDLVRLFLAWGADVNDMNDFGQSPLWIASYQGHRDMVELLVERGAWLDQHDDEQRGWTPLFAAAFERRESVVRYLLDAGASTHLMRKPLPVGEVSNPGIFIQEALSYIASITATSSTSGTTTTDPPIELATCAGIPDYGAYHMAPIGSDINNGETCDDSDSSTDTEDSWEGIDFTSLLHY